MANACSPTRHTQEHAVDNAGAERADAADSPRKQRVARVERERQAKMDDAELREIWISYLAHEGHGLRPDALADLRRMIEALQAAPPLRDAWAAEFLARRERGPTHEPLRVPLFQQVIFPYLEERYRARDAGAARWLARLSQLLFQTPACWEAMGWPGPIGLWREAYRRDPADEESRKALIAEIVSHTRYTLHELPTGVLSDANGATPDECTDLLAQLDELRGLLRGAERDEHEALLRNADFHYHAYRDYGTNKKGHPSYPSFVQARRRA